MYFDQNLFRIASTNKRHARTSQLQYPSNSFHDKSVFSLREKTLLSWKELLSLQIVILLDYFHVISVFSLREKKLIMWKDKSGNHKVCRYISLPLLKRCATPHLNN